MTLAQLIEAEIIPRLLMSHLNPRRRPPAPKTAAAWIDVIGDRDAFARLFLDDDRTEILNRLQRAIDDGVGPGIVCRDLLAPVAQSLRVQWEERRCSFADLMCGLVCLDAVLRDIRRSRALAEPEGEGAACGLDWTRSGMTRN
jgi:hypothetical protein